jgi:hypothetical protein
VNWKHYLHWMKKTQPVLSHPRLTDDALDLWHMLSQLEVLEAFWPEWNPRTGERGANPGISAKALLTITATLGHSAHFDDNHKLLNDPRLRSVFEWIEATSSAATGRTPNPYKVQSHEQVLRQIRKIVGGVPEHAVAANIAMHKAMHALHPASCVYLGIDGTASKAWAAQVGTQDELEEARIRRHAPNAGPRTIERRSDDGKVYTTFWRGWWLVVLVDLATGLPLIWKLIDANKKEADALSGLLHDLYRLWPDCPAKFIVADAAYDEEAIVGECLVNYGIQLVAHRRPTWARTEYPLSRFDSESISKYTGTGLAIGRIDGVPLIRDGVQFASRDGLKPGEPSNPYDFRVRYHFPNGTDGGRPSLAMRLNWPALSPLPHAKNVGAENHHSKREALEARRNQCEALNSALKLGRKLNLESADRTHTPFEPTVEALLSLALMNKTAFALADQRKQRGLHPELPPPSLADALAL